MNLEFSTDLTMSFYEAIGPLKKSVIEYHWIIFHRTKLDRGTIQNRV